MKISFADRAALPVTLSNVRAAARLDHNELDDLLASVVVPAVVEAAETYTNRSFISRVITATFDRVEPGWRLTLPYGPVESITSVTYTDDDGAETVAAAGDYYLSGDVLVFDALTAMRRAAGLAVVYTAGYGTAPGAVPPIARLAIIKAAAEEITRGADTERERVYTLPVNSRTLLDNITSLV